MPDKQGNINFLTMQRVEFHSQKKEDIESILNKKRKILEDFTKDTSGLFIIQTSRGLATIHQLQMIFKDRIDAFFDASYIGVFDQIANLSTDDFICIDLCGCTDIKQTFHSIKNLAFKKIIIVTYEDKTTIENYFVSE